MKTSKIILSAACALLFTASCRQEKVIVEPVITNQRHEEMNVAYGNNPLQKMDVYFPEGYDGETPVAFLIHGGGFIAGTKEEFAMQAELFRAQGFVTVNISYRLVDTTGLLQLPPLHVSGGLKVSDQVADVRAAVQKYRAEAPAWGTGTGNMYMAGHGAGATLALLYGEGMFNADNHIKACGNWAGVTDFSIPSDSLINTLDPRYVELLSRLAGATPDLAHNLYFMAISPYWVAYNKGGHPAFSAYPEFNVVLGQPGEALFGLINTQNFHTLLRNRGIAEKLTIYAGSDHGFGMPTGAWDSVINETARFFKAR